MDYPEYLGAKLEEADDIFNTLCLIYNPASHDAFTAALMRFAFEKLEMVAVDKSEHEALTKEVEDSELWRDLYIKTNDRLYTLCDILNDLSHKYKG